MNMNENKWTCKACTFFNNVNSSKCAMCGSFHLPEGQEGEQFTPSDAEVNVLAMSLDNKPLLDAFNNNKPPKVITNNEKTCVVLCLFIFSIIIIVFSIINLRKMEKYDYKPGIDWNVSILVICIVFLLLTCVAHRLYYKKRVNNRYMSIITCIDCVFIIFACIVVLYWLIYDPRPVESECFDADSTVWIKTNITSNETNEILLRDLQIGDYLLTVDPNNGNNIFWEEVLVRVHYEWYDNKNDFYSMRRIYLENNITSITMSNDHFIFVSRGGNANKPTIVKAESVEIADALYYYDYNEKMNRLLKVTDIEENLLRQKRVYFTMSQYVLVNNIIASPFIGPNPIYHTILHKLFVANIILIKYIWPTFMSSMFASVGVILMNGSYLVCIHWVEISMFIVTIFLYKNIFKFYCVSTQKAQ